MRHAAPLSVAVLLVFLAATAVLACTIGVADGSVSRDGRPLLWKGREGDTDGRSQVVHFTGAQYDYIGMRAVGDPSGAWMGLNTAGLCTGNSYVERWDNNTLMNHILGNFSTVAQVRDFIQQEFNASTLNVIGCFPFADAQGDAAVFEICGSEWYIEYNTQDPDRGPQGLLGWVVRANEFHQHTDGTDDTSIGDRYESAAYNTGGLIGINELSARTIIQGNDGANDYEYMRYGPGRPLATLARNTAHSAMIVHGVAPGEDPALATMWAMPGHPNYSLAVPTWAAVSNIPACLSSGDFATRARSLYSKGGESTAQASTFPFEAHVLAEVEDLLHHWRQCGTPTPDEMTRVETRMAEDAYSLLECMDDLQRDNKAPTVLLSVAAMDDLTVNFDVAAADEDGTVETYVWDFGDDETSTSPSPAHTYAAPGWYLVSCTVTDDDGVSITDWRHLNVPPLAGDLNCDGAVDNFDVDAFVLALVQPEAYYATYPDCNHLHADANGDGSVDSFDIDPFVDLLTGG